MTMRQQNGIVLEEQGGPFAAPPPASRGCSGDANAPTASSMMSMMTTPTVIAGSVMPTAAAARRDTTTIIEATPSNTAPTTTTTTTKVHDLTPSFFHTATNNTTNAGRVSPDISALTEASANAVVALPSPKQQQKQQQLITVTPPHQHHPLAVWDSKADAKSFAETVCDYTDACRETFEERGVAYDEKELMQMSMRRIELQENRHHEFGKEMRGYAVNAYHLQADREHQEKLHRESINVQREEKDWVCKLTSERKRCEAALSTYILYSAVAFVAVNVFRFVPYIVHISHAGLPFAVFTSCDDIEIDSGGGYFYSYTASVSNFVGVGVCYAGQFVELLIKYFAVPLMAAILATTVVNKLPEVIQKIVYTATVAVAILHLGLVSIPYIVYLAIAFGLMYAFLWHDLKQTFAKHKAKLKTTGSYPSNKDLNDAIEAFDCTFQLIQIMPGISLLLGMLFAMLKSLLWD